MTRRALLSAEQGKSENAAAAAFGSNNFFKDYPTTKEGHISLYAKPMHRVEGSSNGQHLY